MTVLEQEQPLEKLLQGVDIPPCPEILINIDQELAKDAPNQREIARLISQDVALSGHVMQIANSPAFSTGHQIGSIMQAINILGSRQLFNLVVAQLLKIALAGKPEVPMDRFWESSAQTARLASELARRLRCVRPDVAYTFGLFHDCGIPLLMKRFPQVREVLAEANACEERSFTAVEEAHLGTNHAVVGYFLAKRWRLPADVTEAILHHHDYAVLGDPDRASATVRALIAVSVLAEHIIRLHAGLEGDQEWGKAVEPACALFGLSLGAVDDLIEDMRDWLE